MARNGVTHLISSRAKPPALKEIRTKGVEALDIALSHCLIPHGLLISATFDSSSVAKL
jgi:hypothetical protein